MRVLSVELPTELHAQLQEWLEKRAKDEAVTVSKVIENMIRKQLLRKR